MQYCQHPTLKLNHWSWLSKHNLRKKRKTPPSKFICNLQPSDSKKQHLLSTKITSSPSSPAPCALLAEFQNAFGHSPWPKDGYQQMRPQTFAERNVTTTTATTTTTTAGTGMLVLRGIDLNVNVGMVTWCWYGITITIFYIYHNHNNHHNHNYPSPCLLIM